MPHTHVNASCLYAHFEKARPQFTCASHHAWQPPTDVFETDQCVVVRMEIGGVQQEDIVICMGENQVLTVRGIRRDPRSGEPRGYHQMEISYGPFQRNVYIPKQVDTEGAYARYDAGCLEIVLPISKRTAGPVRFVVTVIR